MKPKWRKLIILENSRSDCLFFFNALHVLGENPNHHVRMQSGA